MSSADDTRTQLGLRIAEARAGREFDLETLATETQIEIDRLERF